MAFTRKMLKALGIEDDKIDQIVEAHTEVTDALKKERDKYKEGADKLPDIQKELDELRAKGDDGWKDKYEAEKAAFASYKKDVEGKAAAETRMNAARAYLEGKGITGNNLDIAVMAAQTAIDALEMDGDKIKDAKGLDELVAGKLAALVTTQNTHGANPATPPAGGSGSEPAVNNRAEIYKKDERGRYIYSAHERQQMLRDEMMKGQK